MFRLILVLFHLTYLQAYTPEGYIGCFMDLQKRILTGKSRSSSTNSGEECIQYCKEDGYRYAGTEYRNECYCGHFLRIKVYTTFQCIHTCTGNKFEKCGGHWRISVYDITLIKKESTTSTYTSPTTTQTHLPTIGVEDDSGKSMIGVYIAVPLGLVVLLLILLLAVFTRQRRKKRNNLLQISQETGSIPNIYAHIIESNLELSNRANKEKPLEYAMSYVYADTYDDHFEEGKKRHITQEVEETETYNTLTKQHKKDDKTDNPYHHVTNLANDETYSVCSGNQFSNEQRYTNNTYSHITDCTKQTHNTSSSDFGDHVYNTLQLKKNRNLETSKSVDVEEVSDNQATTVALSIMLDIGDYSHLDKVALEQFEGIDKSTGGDNVYYNDNGYISNEIEVKNREFELGK